MKEYKSITLSKFLSRYMAVDGKALTKVSHADVKILFPSIQRTSFEYAEKHQEDIMMGRILIVFDGKTTIPYIVPKEDEITDSRTTMPHKESKKEKRHHYDYSRMKIYELKQLLNARFNTYKVSRNARQELESRGVLVKKKKYKRIKTVDMEEYK